MWRAQRCRLLKRIRACDTTLTVSTQDSKLDSPVLKQEQLMFRDTRIKQSLNFSLSKNWDFPIFITTVYPGGHNLNTTTQIASALKIKNPNPALEKE